MKKSNIKQEKKTLILGAGDTGHIIARKILKEQAQTFRLLGFLDDSPEKQDISLAGIPVIGILADLPELIKLYNIELVIVAVTNMEKDAFLKIEMVCKQAKVALRRVPGIEDLLLKSQPLINFSDIPADIPEDSLLNRAPVELDDAEIRRQLYRKTVLITGAGGSIGSEICRQLLKYEPEKLILLGHGENSIYLIEQELRELVRNTILVPIIADIKNGQQMHEIVEEYMPNAIYHAAAHKHVTLMEQNPHEAIRNNVIGTKNISAAADKFGVQSFVMISSDKAVNSTGVMGASKRMCEMVVQEFAQKSHTKFSAVRFGNVLGSRGSVVPVFKKQIAKGGPVTVTDSRMTRFFMTIPEAASLVLQAGALSKGGEIFVLDMGKEVRILELAQNIIKLSGYSLDDIEIKFTGLRPGEKLYEELLLENELEPKQIYPKIYVGKTKDVNFEMMYEILENCDKWSKVKLREEMITLANSNRTVQKI
ncbi:polysaccharide biosynthesis protein [Paenilisteria newyorkensis]|uniref:polysaccharide biosynthesis protein n=1 Tax=Listeria newyorkensis TaxID=1497681 RepID=UPI000669F3C1|nr:nucleoside-diphosphate sugar epimerase/dehydratase [Listeria newyorkensis]KMT62191.1 capsular polysaccharide biosynthesis protein [Listeria newyorkensis]